SLPTVLFVPVLRYHRIFLYRYCSSVESVNTFTDSSPEVSQLAWYTFTPIRTAPLIAAPLASCESLGFNCVRKIIAVCTGRLLSCGEGIARLTSISLKELPGITT